MFESMPWIDPLKLRRHQLINCFFKPSILNRRWYHLGAVCFTTGIDSIYQISIFLNWFVHCEEFIDYRLNRFPESTSSINISKWCFLTPLIMCRIFPLDWCMYLGSDSELQLIQPTTSSGSELNSVHYLRSALMSLKSSDQKILTFG